MKQWVCFIPCSYVDRACQITVSKSLLAHAERGEVAADDDCIVDFSNRVPPESAQRRSETPLSTSDSDMSPPAGEQRWHSQGFQRPRSRSPTPDRGYSNRHLAYSNQRASPVYDAPADHPRERASPTYERYRARSQERDSPEYDQAYASGRRRAGLGHEGGTRGDGYPEAGHVRSKATESMVQRHHEEFLKRQEKWQLADDEQQRQRELLKQALPAEQARIKRVLEQAEKQRNEDDAMQERLVDLMMAKVLSVACVHNLCALMQCHRPASDASDLLQHGRRLFSPSGWGQVGFVLDAVVALLLSIQCHSSHDAEYQAITCEQILLMVKMSLKPYPDLCAYCGCSWFWIV